MIYPHIFWYAAPISKTTIQSRTSTTQNTTVAPKAVANLTLTHFGLQNQLYYLNIKGENQQVNKGQEIIIVINFLQFYFAPRHRFSTAYLFPPKNSHLFQKQVTLASIFFYAFVLMVQYQRVYSQLFTVFLQVAFLQILLFPSGDEILFLLALTFKKFLSSLLSPLSFCCHNLSCQLVLSFSNFPQRVISNLYLYLALSLSHFQSFQTFTSIDQQLIQIFANSYSQDGVHTSFILLFFLYFLKPELNRS